MFVKAGAATLFKTVICQRLAAYRNSRHNNTSSQRLGLLLRALSANVILTPADAQRLWSTIKKR